MSCAGATGRSRRSPSRGSSASSTRCPRPPRRRSASRSCATRESPPTPSTGPPSPPAEAGGHAYQSRRTTVVDYTPDPIHEDIRDAVRTMCKAFPDEYWMEHDTNHEFPWEFYDAVAKGGWLGLTVPEEYGGGGLGVTEAAIVEQEISASGAGMGGCSAVHIGIFGFEPIIHHGSEDLKQRFLPRVVTGELHTSFA